jgi:hypothetical protein
VYFNSQHIAPLPKKMGNDKVETDRDVSANNKVQKINEIICKMEKCDMLYLMRISQMVDSYLSVSKNAV